MTPLDAVVFDFDLTLADSRRGAHECVNFALTSLGLSPVDAQTAAKSVGLPMFDAHRALARDDDLARCEEFARLFVEHADRVMVDLTEIYPAVPGVLRALRDRGIRTAIVSTKYRYRIEETLRRAGIPDLTDRVVGGEDVAQHKPDPEGLRAALTGVGVSPANATYVGDHLVDAMAARAAGVSFVGVLSGTTDREGFADASVEALIPSVGELLRYLAR